MVSKNSRHSEHTQVVVNGTNSNVLFCSVYRILEDITVKVEDRHVDSRVKEIADSIASKCQGKVIQQIRANKNINVIEAYEACAQPLITNQIEESNKEIHEQASLRTGMSVPWEDYTCADFDLPTTSPTRKQTWNYHGQEYSVGVLLDRNSAKVHYVKVSWCQFAWERILVLSNSLLSH